MYYVTKKRPHKKASVPDGFTGEFHQSFTDKIVPMFHKVCHGTKNEDFLIILMK